MLHTNLVTTTARITTAFLGVGAVCCLIIACSVNPATGQRQLNFLSESSEVAMGEEHAPSILKELGGEIPSTKIQNHVTAMGKNMAKMSERPDLPWEFFVTDSDVINAFALPGGKIFVTRGLISKMDNDAQLAAVVGHEIGHVTAQHSGQQMAHSTIVGIGAAGVGIVTDAVFDDDLLTTAAGVGASLAATGLVLQYSRSHESQADMLGLRYMTKAGYNPEGMVQLMEILRDEAAAGYMPEFMMTHPLPQTRIERVQADIDRDYSDYNQPGRYKWGKQSFQANVAQPLKKLPPPKTAQAKAKG